MDAAAAAADAGYLEYHKPGIIDLLVIISFFFFLALAEWISDKLFKAGLIGQMLVGLVYGAPVGNIMPIEWQETFVSLGFIGLILIIFEGGLTVHLGLLKANFFLSVVAAAIGIFVPIGLCFALLYVGFGYEPVETFIISAALSVTSLGTTFVVIGSVAKGIDFAKTKVGTVLISAAVVSDVSGLIMASVIQNLGTVAEDENANLGWLIGRPVLASVLMGIFSPLVAKYLAGPFFRWYIEDLFARFKHVSNIVLMVLVLCAFITIAEFAGTSSIYGAFLAGTFLSSLPCIHPDAPFMVFSREHGETEPGKTPTFIHTFEKYLLGAQTYILQPMFFASIGFAIPFRKLWTGRAIWTGIVFTLLMLAGKLVVGAVVPVRDLLTTRPLPKPISSVVTSTWRPATLLAVAMVARGEIGLLIVQIGLNETPFLSEEAFVTAIWATVLSTIVGPIVVGLLLKRHGTTISRDERWGMQNVEDMTRWDSDDLLVEEGRASRWASRRHSRAVSRATSERTRSRAQSRARSRGRSIEQGRDMEGPRLSTSSRPFRNPFPDAEEISQSLRNATEADGTLRADAGREGENEKAAVSEPALGPESNLERRRVITILDAGEDEKAGVSEPATGSETNFERRRVITYEDSGEGEEFVTSEPATATASDTNLGRRRVITYEDSPTALRKEESQDVEMEKPSPSLTTGETQNTQNEKDDTHDISNEPAEKPGGEP